ncbi:MAG: helix-turn-helix transcriptional regulator [Hydrococcus sp. RM1_1_31]|nr:helix-turn-helix transcriptional regulator [Hydrococcus sp. RM1_1_31]
MYNQIAGGNNGKTFGQILKELRRAKGVSQRNLAEKVGVDFSYISKIENDRLPPPAADTIVRICEALSVPPDELLSTTGKMPTSAKEMIGTSSAALQFIREAEEMKLSESEWEQLVEKLKYLRKD